MLHSTCRSMLCNSKGGRHHLHHVPLLAFQSHALAAGIIAKENVQTHFRHMKEAGCNVTLKEFDFGHLDFTFAVKDELRNYVANRLLRSKRSNSRGQ